jgi:predicted transcriptional regulator
MNHWTRADRVIAYVRLMRAPLSLRDIADGLDEDMWRVSATVSKLYEQGELNRTRPDGKYLYTDPDYDELLRLRRRLEVSNDT